MHKRWISVTVLALVIVAGVLSGLTRAEEEATEKAQARKEKKVRELLELTGASRLALQVVHATLEHFKNMPGMTPQLIERLRSLARMEDLVDLVVPIYMKHLDEKTLDAGIGFFRTPEGRKWIEAQPKMVKESMAAGAEWGRQLAMKAMEEVRKAPAQPGRFEALKTEDMSNVRKLVGLLAFQSKTPMIDGRVDVYALVRNGDLQEQHFPMFKSARFGSAPSKEEIKRGDYESFPYERFKGLVDREKMVPLLWDKKPDQKNGRVVGFSNGAVKYYPEAEVQELLRKHGQLPENPAK